MGLLDFIGGLLFGQAAKPTTPAQAQPYIRSIASPEGKKLANYWWSQVFYDNDNLQRLAGSNSIYPTDGHGLVYRYIIRDRVRYIGQTRERSLKWRMTKNQPGGHIGYSPTIKKHMLNAYRQGVLRIETESVRIDKLDDREQELIARYGPTNRLWNIEHNPNFKKTNLRR